jgi:hypothetical protein
MTKAQRRLTASHQHQLLQLSVESDRWDRNLRLQCITPTIAPLASGTSHDMSQLCTLITHVQSRTPVMHESRCGGTEQIIASAAQYSDPPEDPTILGSRLVHAKPRSARLHGLKQLAFGRSLPCNYVDFTISAEQWKGMFRPLGSSSAQRLDYIRPIGFNGKRHLRVETRRQRSTRCPSS